MATPTKTQNAGTLAHATPGVNNDQVDLVAAYTKKLPSPAVFRAQEEVYARMSFCVLDYMEEVNKNLELGLPLPEVVPLNELVPAGSLTTVCAMRVGERLHEVRVLFKEVAEQLRTKSLELEVLLKVDRCAERQSTGASGLNGQPDGLQADRDALQAQLQEQQASCVKLVAENQSLAAQLAHFKQNEGQRIT